MFGLLAGATFIALFPQLAEVGAVTAVTAAPTSDEYRAQAADVLSPFVSQVSAMAPSDFGRAGTEMTAFAAKTQEALLALRVPGELREAHLSFVLLLDQWKRALSAAGTEADRAVAVERTRSLLVTYPWLVAATAAPAAPAAPVAAPVAP
jgi:hypothetical protein